MRHLLLAAALAVLAFPVVGSAADVAGPASVPALAEPVAPSGLSRAAFVKGFEKTDLRVEMTLGGGRYEDLLDRRGADSEEVKAVLSAYKSTRAVRDMAIVGGLRGKATVVQITVRAADGLVEEGYAKGDPRTEQGKANVHENVLRVVQRFRDRVLAREEAAVFDGAGSPAR